MGQRTLEYIQSQEKVIAVTSVLIYLLVDIVFNVP